MGRTVDTRASQLEGRERPHDERSYRRSLLPIARRRDLDCLQLQKVSQRVPTIIIVELTDGVDGKVVVTQT